MTIWVCALCSSPNPERNLDAVGLMLAGLLGAAGFV